MLENQFNFALALPEIVLCILAIGILLLEAFTRSKDSSLSYIMSLGTLVLLSLISLYQWNAGLNGMTFYGQYVADPMAHFMKIVSYLAVMATLVYSRQYLIDRHMVKGGEYYALTMLALLGQMVMISASSMLSIYLGLELMSLALYALVAVRR